MSLTTPLVVLAVASAITVAAVGPIASTIDQADRVGQEQRARHEEIRSLSAPGGPGLVTPP